MHGAPINAHNHITQRKYTRSGEHSGLESQKTAAKPYHLNASTEAYSLKRLVDNDVSLRHGAQTVTGVAVPPIKGAAHFGGVSSGGSTRSATGVGPRGLFY